MNNTPNITIDRNELKKLFNFATSKTHFLFNGRFFDKIDGFAMGSPLAPVLANIFMGYNESKWINEYNLNKPKFYRRYVDDILTIFDNKQDSDNFLNYLNTCHPNIKFTTESQINNSIPFLDVLVSDIGTNHLNLRTYYKPTYSGLLFNYNSFTPESYKISLIKCLIDRAFKISNSWINFHKDLKIIKDNLSKNAYPSKLVDKIIKHYIDKKHDTTIIESDKSEISYFKLPYIGKFS